MAGKVFLVSGSSSGVGETLAIMLAKEGACVTLCGRDEARLRAAQEKCIQASGGHAKRFAVAQGDILQAESRKRYVQTTFDTFGRLDVLVCNAGIYEYEENTSSVFNATEANYEKVMDTNVKGVFFLMKEAVPYLEQSKGCIVSVSSMVSTLVVANNTVYAMTKAAVDHMTRCVALDLAPKGIRVNSVNPSFFVSRIRRFAGDEAANEASTRKAEAFESTHQPLEGRCVTQEEVANAIMFLASDKAGFITGQCLAVDGGRKMMLPFGYA